MCPAGYFKNIYEEQRFPSSKKYDLAENLLCKAGSWNLNGDAIRMSGTLLKKTTPFNDLGSLGKHLYKIFKKDNYLLGCNNVCIGDKDKVKTVACRNNLFIPDLKPVVFYGLHNVCIIENQDEGITLVCSLDSLYEYALKEHGIQQSKRSGIEILHKEDSDKITGEGVDNRIIIYKLEEKYKISRNNDKLYIKNCEYPELSEQEFELLAEKAKKDPELVQHLIDVLDFAELFAEKLTRNEKKLLKTLCLFHDIGGVLCDELQKEEDDISKDFKKISDLQKNLLDTRIIAAFVEKHFKKYRIHEDTIHFLNDSVNSAIEFINHFNVCDVCENELDIKGYRDLIIVLIIIQGQPNFFSGIEKYFKKEIFKKIKEKINIEEIFVSFKAAEIICQGKWRWKRERTQKKDFEFLTNKVKDLERWIETIYFFIDELNSAKIDPTPYINRLNNFILNKNICNELKDRFNRIMRRWQNGESQLPMDTVYLHLLNGTRVPIKTIKEIKLKNNEEDIKEYKKKISIIQNYDKQLKKDDIERFFLDLEK